MHKIENPGVLESCATALESLGHKSSSTEAIAVDAVNYLYNVMNDGEGDPCALIRFFRTIPYGDLTPHLKRRVDQILMGKAETRTNCLTLLASRGTRPGWNDRFQSEGHQVIPLLSDQMIASAPMVAQLIKRLGIDVSQVINPSATLFLNAREKKYNVMYVAEAEGDPAIVSQDNFVVPEKIRSVIGFGGLLPTGDMFAVLMFLRVFVPESTASRFGLLARALESAIVQLRPEGNYKANILIADEENSSRRLIRLLGEHHHIVQVTTLAAAEAAIAAQRFDLIVCGTRFDDSRMFNLLRRIKLDKHQRPKPFICLKQAQPNIVRTADSAAPAAARLIGAACYLDAVEMNDQALMLAIDSYLPKDIWMTPSS